MKIRIFQGILSTRTTRITLAALVFYLAPCMLCAQTDGEQPDAAAKTSTTPPPPALADIIPLASDLQGRLARLENEIKVLPDVNALEKEYAAFNEVVDHLGSRLEEINKSGGRKWPRLVNLRKELDYEQSLFVEIEKPFVKTISQLVNREDDWLAAKQRWRDWNESLDKDEIPVRLKTMFSEARAAIESALQLIVKQLNALLQVQEKGNSVKVKMENLDAEIGAAIKTERGNYLLTSAPPMFTREYFSKFHSQLWTVTKESTGKVIWPGKRFFENYAGIIFVQLLLLLIMIIFFKKNRQVLLESEHWKFLALRPFSSGFFVVILSQFFVPRFQLFPMPVQLFIVFFGGISFVRILRCVTAKLWIRKSTIFIVVLFVITMVVNTFNLPIPLYRLYNFAACLLALFLLDRWLKEGIRQDDNPFLLKFIHLGQRFLFGAIIFAQLLGKDGLAAYLYESSLTSVAISLAFFFFIYLVRGALHWTFLKSPVWEIKQLRSEADQLVKSTSSLAGTLIVGFVVIPMLLTTWGIYDNAPEAVSGLLGLGFKIGPVHITLELIIAIVGTLYGTYLCSWILPKVILDEKVAGGGMERGVRMSVATLIKYFIVFVGILLAFFVLGFDLTKLTIMLSALGVGIGFGLQGIVNNFISGLIMLFEQPVRIGDMIEIDGNFVLIKSIGLRSTIVHTYDEAEVIIPNADLISNQVTNWTLSDRQARAIIPVGVAYGSDIPLVMETLLACAENNEKIASSPKPQVIFVQFGESSLDLEFRVWVKDVDNRLSVKSELQQEIDRRFREAKIEIPFPQRDLHLRSVDNSVMLRQYRNEEGDDKAPEHS